MSLLNTTFRLYKTVELISDLQPTLGDCFVNCLEDGFLYNSEGGVFVKISNIMFFTRSDTYTAPGNGVTVDASQKAMQTFTVQVKGTGAVPTSWVVHLEGSLNGVDFENILEHNNTIGDGVVMFSGTASYPCLYFRSRVEELTLGSATNIVVSILGIQ